MDHIKNHPLTKLGLAMGIALCVLGDSISNIRITTGVGATSVWHIFGSVLMVALFITNPPATPWRILLLAGIIVDAVWLWIGDVVSPYDFVTRGNYLLWVAVASWLIVRNVSPTTITTWERYTTHILLATPLVFALNIFAGYSPLTAVYADLYGGGDTWISLGSSSLLLFVSLWGGWQAWLRRASNTPRWGFSVTSGLLALTQALANGEWRLVPWVIISAILMDLGCWRWPQRARTMVALWPGIFCVGYFMTLKYTTILSWNLTVWGGVVVFAAGIGYALTQFAMPQTNEGEAV